MSVRELTPTSLLQHIDHESRSVQPGLGHPTSGGLGEAKKAWTPSSPPSPASTNAPAIPDTQYGTSNTHHATRITAWSTNGETSLITGTTTINSGLLHSASVITIEAFGLFSDPGGNTPNTTFKLKLGSTAIVTETQPAATANWHIRSQITVRTNGTTGTVVGTLFPVLDNTSLTAFPGDSQTTTMDTTVSLTVDLTASIADATGAEAVHCDQLNNPS